MIPVLIAGAQALAASPAVGSVVSFVAKKVITDVATSAVKSVLSGDIKPLASLAEWKNKLKDKFAKVEPDKKPENRRKMSM